MRRTTASHLVALVLALSVASARPTGAGAADDDVVLSPKELSSRVRAALADLPEIKAKLKRDHRAEAVKACRLYATAAKRASELDDAVRLRLGRLGVNAGFHAGDPETMLAGAKRYWDDVPEASRPGAAALMLTWAGIFAGDASSATKAVDLMAAKPPQPGLQGWAKEMKALAEVCDKPVQLSFKLLDGRLVTSEKLRGKVVVLDFWATWCKPCIDALPTLRQFHADRAKDKNMVMISLSGDRSAAEAKRGASDHKMKWPQAMDKGVGRMFGVRSIPHMIVISPKGHILYRAHPGAMDQIKWVTDFARRQAARMAEKAKGKDKPEDKPKVRPRPMPPHIGPRRPGPTTATAPAPAPRTTQPSDPETLAAERLRLAAAYRGAGMTDRAKAILRDLIAKYPNTAAAKKAVEQLKK